MQKSTTLNDLEESLAYAIYLHLVSRHSPLFFNYLFIIYSVQNKKAVLSQRWPRDARYI